MIRVIVEDLDYAYDHETGCDCGGGYGVGDTVYVDARLENEGQKKLALVHEILDLRLNGGRKQRRVKHSFIDPLAIDIIDGLNQL